MKHSVSNKALAPKAMSKAPTPAVRVVPGSVMMADPFAAIEHFNKNWGQNLIKLTPTRRPCMPT